MLNCSCKGRISLSNHENHTTDKNNSMLVIGFIRKEENDENNY